LEEIASCNAEGALKGTHQDNTTPPHLAFEGGALDFQLERNRGAIGRDGFKGERQDRVLFSHVSRLFDKYIFRHASISKRVAIQRWHEPI